MFANLTGTEIVFFIIALLFSVILHEIMHGFMAYKLGDNTALEMGRLTLNPLKHIDISTTILLPLFLVLLHAPPIFAAKPVPFNPSRLKFDEYGAALVALAGPMTNLILAIIGGILIHIFISGSYNVLNFLIIFTEINVALFIFNLIPFPPLDGSRVLYAFAPEPLQEVMRKIESFGFIAILLIVLFLFQFIAPFIQGLDSGLFNLIIKI